VTEKIDIDQLTELMENTSPEEIRARHWDTMSEDARAAFAHFETLCADLEMLPRDLAALLPPVPEERRPAEIVPIRRNRLSAWMVPLVAAAAFFAGVMVPEDAN